MDVRICNRCMKGIRWGDLSYKIDGNLSLGIRGKYLQCDCCLTIKRGKYNDLQKRLDNREGYKYLQFGKQELEDILSIIKIQDIVQVDNCVMLFQQILKGNN